MSYVDNMTELEYLNDIPWVELQDIDGIGSQVAGKIVNNRSFWGEFKGFYELRKITGISTKTVQKLNKHIARQIEEGI